MGLLGLYANYKQSVQSDYIEHQFTNPCYNNKRQISFAPVDSGIFTPHALQSIPDGQCTLDELSDWEQKEVPKSERTKSIEKNFKSDIKTSSTDYNG